VCPFLRPTRPGAVGPLPAPCSRLSRGVCQAGAVVVMSGDDVDSSTFALNTRSRIAVQVTRRQLQNAWRLADPGLSPFAEPVMSDLGLVRCISWLLALAEAAPLRRAVEARRGRHLRATGFNLNPWCKAADGSLHRWVIRHHYAANGRIVFCG